MPKTYYLSNALISHVLRGPSTGSPGSVFLPPNQTFIGLYTTSPTAAGGGVEVSDPSYFRRSITFGAPVNGSTLSALDILFPRAFSWGTISAFAILDAVSSGNMLYFDQMPSPLPVISGEILRIPAGQIAIAEF